jgi:hypothetical protein
MYIKLCYLNNDNHTILCVKENIYFKVEKIANVIYCLTSGILI